MDLVPLICGALVITFTLVAVECVPLNASANLDTALKEKDQVLELRQEVMCVEVQSVNHKFGANYEGQYFNFYTSDVDAILGSNWATSTTYRIDQRRNGEIVVAAQEVKLWKTANGGSVGNGHGRYNGNTLAPSPGQWKAGDSFCFTTGDILWNNVAMTIRTGEVTDSFTIGGQPWKNGLVYYTNLPIHFPMYGTHDVNTGDSNVLDLPKAMVVYMIRSPSWNSVPLDGWTLISTGNYLGTKYGDDINLFMKEFAKGRHIIDNNSAMYLFADLNNDTTQSTEPATTTTPVTPTTTKPSETCIDTDNGATDKDGDNCVLYNREPQWCGRFDDSDFFSKKMCCGCGGGKISDCVNTDSWTNGYGYPCESYTNNWCQHGGAMPGKEWTLGSKYNYPEHNCCVCGKGNVRPTCEDNLLNQEEEQVDCGGPNCRACVKQCIGDALTWNVGWGPCDQYKDYLPNHEFCHEDCDVNGNCAADVCEECGSCFLSVTSRQNAAIQACREFGNGWGVKKVSDGALICTLNTVHWQDNCNTCDTWRLLVWKDGSHEYEKGNSRYSGVDLSTKSGKYYGGHLPCGNGANFPLCGEWENPTE